MSASLLQNSEDSHLMSINEDWFVWRNFCLRGSGFDVDLIHRLSVEKSPALAAAIFEQEKNYRHLRREIIGSLDLCCENASESDRKVFLKIKAKLRKDKVFDSPVIPDRIKESLAKLKLLKIQIAETKSEFNEAFDDDWLESGRRLWETGQIPELQEAVIWQNRQAFNDFINPWLETPTEKLIQNRWKKRRELLLTGYLQRYTTKNDTIGFFGQVAWGNISDSGDKISISQGDNFLAYRNCFTEGWAIDALADSFSADPDVALRLNPRRLSYVRLEGSKLFVGDEKPQTLPPKFVSVLAHCSGRENVSEITEQLLADKGSEIIRKRKS